MIKQLIVALTVLLIGCIFPAAAKCGGGPENVAVIINPTNQSSMEVANAYIEDRGIPGSNVFYIPWAATGPRASGLHVRDKIIRPILDQIEKRGVREQIDCIAFSTGYPYLVDCSPLFPGKQLTGPSRPILSLTSAMYLFEYLLDDQPELLALNSNAYFAPTTAAGSSSRSFSANTGWGPGGVPLPTGGRNYLLATALGVAHGRGNTTAEIVANLRRSREADGSKPTGTIYYMRSNDVRSRTRHDSFAAAAEELRNLGVKAEVLNGSAPLNVPDIAGLTTGSAQLSLRSSGSRIIPGALVDNLTSGAGQFVVPATAPHPQTPVSEFLRLGAAGASGAVVEPYAIPQKFPSAMLHVHYVRGCSLAESFYRSVSGPFQLIIVGDPLCQPWATPPTVTVAGLPADGAISGRFELFVNGKRSQTVALGESFSIASNSLPDGYIDLRVVAIDDTPIEVQGSWHHLAHVKNGGDAIQITASSSVLVSETLQVTVASTTIGQTRVFHNGRELGVLPQGSGKLLIAATRLGKGKVEIYAQQQAKRILRSRPVPVEIR
jgi:hypothetical protein